MTTKKEEEKYSPLEESNEATSPETPEAPLREAEVQPPNGEQQPQGDVDALKESVENMQLDDASLQDAQAQSSQLKALAEEERIKKLLQLALDPKKGVVYAVRVAKNMNDPYILDTFHDRLIEEGLYKQFLK